MPDSSGELATLIATTTSLMEELILLLEKEQCCVVDIDLAVLEELDELKKQLLVNLETANNSCRQIFRNLAAEVGHPEAENLSILLPYLPSPLRAPLQKAQDQLLKKNDKLQRVMTFNRELLRSSLQNVNSSLSFFNRIFSASNTYGEGGRMVTGSRDTRLVCKEI